MIPLFLAVASTLLTPASGAPGPVTSQPAQSAKIAWYDKDLDAALKDAKAQSKIVMAFFGSPTIVASTQMSKDALEDASVVDAVKDLICVKLDFEKDRAFATRYAIQEAPVVIWFNSDGTVRDRVGGYKDARAFLGLVARIKLDLGTLNELRKKIAAKGDDIESRFELYKRLREIGDIAGASEQKGEIIKLDPQGTSRASHHFTYDRITGEIEQYWAQTSTLAMHKIEELQTFVELESDPELLWDGWMRLANTHAYLANQSASKGQFADAKDHRTTRRKFIANSWRGVPTDPDTHHEWSVTNAELFWNERDELTTEDKQFALTLTTKLVELYEKDALAHDLHARFLFYTGQRPQSIDEEQKAVDLDPSKADYKTRLKQFRGD